MKRATAAALILFTSLTTSPAPAQDIPRTGATTQAAPVETIGRNDPRRKLLLDGVRGTIEQDLGQKVQFVVDRLVVQGPWAFAILHPRTPAGGEIDFRQTHYREALEEGMFDGDTTYALLRSEGGRWRLLAHAIGPTDVTYAGWPEEFGAPEALFGLNPQ